MNQPVKLLSPPVLVDSTRFSLYTIIEVSRKPKHTYFKSWFQNIHFCARFSPDQSNRSWNTDSSLIQQISPTTWLSEHLQILGTWGYESGYGSQSSPASTFPIIMHHSNQLQLGRYIQLDHGQIQKWKSRSPWLSLLSSAIKANLFLLSKRSNPSEFNL